MRISCKQNMSMRKLLPEKLHFLRSMLISNKHLMLSVPRVLVHLKQMFILLEFDSIK